MSARMFLTANLNVLPQRERKQEACFSNDFVNASSWYDDIECTHLLVLGVLTGCGEQPIRCVDF